MAAPLPPAAATAAPRPSSSVAAAAAVAAATTAAVGTRRQPLLRLRSLERRGPSGPPAPAQPAPGVSASVPDARLMPWTTGSRGDMAAGFEDLILEALAPAPGSEASGR